MKMAAVFPGQGAQHVGMGKYLYDNFKSTQHLFEEANDVLRINFNKLCFDGPESDLMLTENTQPALLLVSVATFQVLKEEVGFKPMAAAGHSIGEYAAVVTAQALDFSSGLRAVRLRGQSMQKAVPVGTGGMLAVMGLTDSETRVLCQWATEEAKLGVLQPANFNSPGQVVISGHQSMVEWLQAHIKESPLDPTKRVKLIPLKVSAPFHCALMEPAQEEMAQVLKDMNFKVAEWPIIQNFVAEPVREAAALRKNLISQVSGPVRWTECVQTLHHTGAEQVIECGPGKVLTGLIKKIEASLPVLSTSNAEELKAAEELIKKANNL